MAMLKKLLHPTKEPYFSSTALMAHKGKINFFASLLSYKGPQDVWIVDSKATDHMYGSSAGLLNFCPCTRTLVLPWQMDPYVRSQAEMISWCLDYHLSL